VNIKALAKFEPQVYALLRIITGALFAFHGLQKLTGFLGHAMPAGSQLWVGGVIELVGGVLIAIGLVTRWAALIASGTMAVAYFQFHWKLEFANYKWLPAINQGELAVVYCFVFLLFAVLGPGIWSVDGKR